MARLNHINLPNYNVPQLTRFFEIGFGFRVVHQRGAGELDTAKLVVLTDPEQPSASRAHDPTHGFILVLMHDKNVTDITYPAIFHVGFVLDSEQDVRDHYVRLNEAGFNPPAPEIINRGGPKAYGFYCKAPGGVVVEVSTFV
jgi:catechol 2,3-dioxygenase-like lactoylglutathione lyase family enzyme